MKTFNWKSILPHLIAVGVFLIVAVLFCYPALESNVVIQQGDLAQSQSVVHQSFVYKELHGHFPLWMPQIFSGMPGFVNIFEGPYNPLYFIDRMFQLWLPAPISYFFLLSIGFYFLTVSFGIRTWVGIIASLAYAYCTYDPIIAAVGHQTKILAMGYAPALIGAVILIFDKKYVAGFVFTALFTALEFQQNHTQISYYTFLIIAIMSVSYLVRWIMAKDFKQVGLAMSISIAAALLGLAHNAVTIIPTYDFGNETKRAGQLVMNNNIDTVTNAVDANNKTKGMSKEYAFQWSYGKAETFSLMFPGVMGYGYHGSQRDGEMRVFPSLSENSNVAKFITEKMGASDEQAGEYAKSMSGSVYWGDQPFTAGPVYLGAIVCFLFLFGMFYLDGKHKWWILIASVLSVLMAWGSHFAAFNNFLFDHLPMYSKFRTPTQILVVPQMLFPIVGALALDKLLSNQNEDTWKKLRLGAIATAVVFAIAGIMYFTLDYAKENKERTSAFNTAFATYNEADVQGKMEALNQKYQPQADNQLYEGMVLQSKGDKQVGKGILTALRSDRAAYFGKDILRSFAFVALAIFLMGMFIRKKLNATVLLAGIGLLTMIDLLGIDSNYLNKTSFINKDEYETNEFPESDADKQILKDTDPNYRVFNYSGGDPFQESKTSYYHKSIGGYHPAKLAIYDDLITFQLSRKLNEQVLNMLNAKYIIQDNPQTKQPMVFPNPAALGNCWLVKGVSFVNGAVAEMRALDAFNPKDTAIVDNKYKADLTGMMPTDSASSIKQTVFDNDAIKYESNTTSAQLAIFSEIFYKDWFAYIDGKPAKVVKANYVLRGLLVPAGKHTIDFKFEPAAYKTGYAISAIASWLIVALLLGFVVWGVFLKEMAWRKKATKQR
ncbi:MAG: YfhO family protein [Chitinophagaceae bacterium]